MNKKETEKLNQILTGLKIDVDKECLRFGFVFDKKNNCYWLGEKEKEVKK